MESKNFSEITNGTIPSAQMTRSSKFRAASSNAGRESVLKDKKILVVDDAPDNQLLISRFLSLSGAEVSAAQNGLVAIEMINKATFDVVVLDIQMPVLDGYQTVKELRKMSFTKPVIALTAHAMSDEKKKCLAMGFDMYLAKPVIRSVLVDAVSSLLEVKN